MLAKLKKFLGIALEAKELISPSSVKSAPKDDMQVLQLAVDELRRRYDKICKDYDTARIKLLTLFGGGLAFLAFLYSDKVKDTNTRDIFFPPTLADQIFYFIGLVLVIGALCILFWSIRPSDWALPLSADRLNKLQADFPTRKAFLSYIKDEYMEANSFCMKMLDRKVKNLAVSINMLFIGAIILLVLKYFGGQ